MKNILLGLALLATTIIAKAQAPTTQEEYNYATKGLKIQRASGLDMKAGYQIVNTTTTTAGAYTVVTEDLLRKSDNSLACTVVTIGTSSWTDGPLYLCIPNPKSAAAINNLCWSSMQFTSNEMQKAMSLALAWRTALMTNNYYNYGKK